MKTKTKKNKQLAFLLAIILCIFTSSCLDVFSFIKDTDVSALTGKNKSQDPDTEDATIVALIPFDSSSDVDKDDLSEVYNEFARALKNDKALEPASLRLWMSKVYKKRNKAPNIFDILTSARRAEIPIDFICHGKVFKSHNQYGLCVSLYPIDKNIDPSYYFRYFSSFGKIDDASEDIIKEIKARGLITQKPLFNKSIFVKNFKINFFTYTILKSGEGALVPLPYLDVNKVTYKKNDHFFNEILLYSLHSSRLVNVWNSNMKRYIKNQVTVPSHIDYVASISIDISEQASRLNVRIIDNKSKKVVYRYKYPFKSLEIDNLHNIMIENTQNIILSLLSNNEKKKIGKVELRNILSSSPVFCENYYIGNGSKKYLLLPTSTKATKFKIANKIHAMYINSIGINYKLFNQEENPIFKK